MAGSKTVVAKEKALAVAAAAAVGDSGALTSSTTRPSSSLLRGGELQNQGMTLTDLNVLLIFPQLDAGVSAALQGRAVTCSSSSSSAAVTLARCYTSTNVASFAAHSVKQMCRLGGQESTAFLPNTLRCPRLAPPTWRQRQSIAKLHGLNARRSPALRVPDIAEQLDLLGKDDKVNTAKEKENSPLRSGIEVPRDGELLASEARQQIFHRYPVPHEQFQQQPRLAIDSSAMPAHPRPRQPAALWQQDARDRPARPTEIGF